MDADPLGRSLARIHASPASWCGCRRSLSPGARQSIRCLAPTHVDANAAHPLGSKRESTASSAISGKSPMCASPPTVVPSPFFRGAATARSIGGGVGARGRSRSSAPRRDPVGPPRLSLLFELHNETANVWSHLLGSFFDYFSHAFDAYLPF